MNASKDSKSSSNSVSQPKKPRVTISLFSVETVNGYNKVFLTQKNNIISLYDNFQRVFSGYHDAKSVAAPLAFSSSSTAATVAPKLLAPDTKSVIASFYSTNTSGGGNSADKKHHNDGFEFVVSILLVPSWDSFSSYKAFSYQERQVNFIADVKVMLAERPNIEVEDFYSLKSLTRDERTYLHQLRALGSNADMIKTLAIINNFDRQHLQIDSNTIIINFNELYKETFGAIVQQDGLNASFYDADYISAHNKMVYTTPSGLLAKSGQLKIKLEQWCAEHKNDLADKAADKNSIYARVFVPALATINMVKKFSLSAGKFRYPVILSETEYYRLSSCMITAVNGSWSDISNLSPQVMQRISAIKKYNTSFTPITIFSGNDCKTADSKLVQGKFDFQCFFNYVRKRTAPLDTHNKMMRFESSIPSTEESCRADFLRLCNIEVEKEAAKQFIKQALVEGKKELVASMFDMLLDKNMPLQEKLYEELYNQLTPAEQALLTRKPQSSSDVIVVLNDVSNSGAANSIGGNKPAM